MTRYKPYYAQAVTRLFLRVVRKEIIACGGQQVQPKSVLQAKRTYRRPEPYRYPKPLPCAASVWNASKIRALVLYQGFSLRLSQKTPVPKNAIAIEMAVLKAIRAAPIVCYHRSAPYFADLIRAHIAGKPGNHVLIADWCQVIPDQQLRVLPVQRTSNHYEIIFPELQYKHASAASHSPSAVFGIMFNCALEIRSELRAGMLRRLTPPLRSSRSGSAEPYVFQDSLASLLRQSGMNGFTKFARAHAHIGVPVPRARPCVYKLERARLKLNTAHLLEDMVWYHGTSSERWQVIQQEGVLFGKRGSGVPRCTYLAADREEALCHGDIVLEVRYNPFDAGGRKKTTNNYCYDCWQMRVYEPIPLNKIKLMGATC